eukprot:SAG22_NODE_34_length_27479_cov_10.947480_12_plen_219_part_00
MAVHAIVAPCEKPSTMTRSRSVPSSSGAAAMAANTASHEVASVVSSATGAGCDEDPSNQRKPSYPASYWSGARSDMMVVLGGATDRPTSSRSNSSPPEPCSSTSSPWAAPAALWPPGSSAAGMTRHTSGPHTFSAPVALLPIIPDRVEAASTPARHAEAARRVLRGFRDGWRRARAAAAPTGRLLAVPPVGVRGGGAASATNTAPSPAFAVAAATGCK